MKTRAIVLVVCTVAVLGVINFLIFQSENLAANGRVVFMQLAPVDPRSLIQGDYMSLRYAMGQNVQTSAPSGFLMVDLNERNIATAAQWGAGATTPAANQVLMRYHRSEFRTHIGPESFFFQEGQADLYRNAKYAELRVSPVVMSFWSGSADRI